MDDYTKTLVSNALNFIRTRQDLIDFVIDENNDLKSTGFMWSNDPRVNDIGNALINDGHSGFSFACITNIRRVGGCCTLCTLFSLFCSLSKSLKFIYITKIINPILTLFSLKIRNFLSTKILCCRNWLQH